MNYTDKPILERQSHIDLSAPCKFAKKAKTKPGQMYHARKNLAIALDISLPKGRQTHCCHLCPNHSQTGQICINPKHVYFGTPKENGEDRTKEKPGPSPKLTREQMSLVRKMVAAKMTPEQKAKVANGAKKGGKIGGKAPCSQKLKKVIKQQVTCPHCGKVGGKIIMARWHFNNCRKKFEKSSQMVNKTPTNDILKHASTVLVKLVKIFFPS